ncbi:hypothetical protein C8Q80DRAFT_146079 [Daedaleopsis nitida]|nr:hypothetical protein C8Q80DRAFT_146079 [Daedaleopsis nitida]
MYNQVALVAQSPLGALLFPTTNHKYSSHRYCLCDFSGHLPHIATGLHHPVLEWLPHLYTTLTMTDMTTSSPSIATAELRDFFDRLAAGDFHGLANELNISYKPIPRSREVVKDVSPNDSLPADGEEDPDASIQSIDSVESLKFQPTTEGLHRAVALLRGDDHHRSPPTPEEEEAFQFTFRLMIHKLYSITDFARMVDDVVRTSQERFRPLSPEFTTGCRRSSLSFSFEKYHSDGDAFTLLHSPTSPTDTSSCLPSSPSSWTLDRFPSPKLECADDTDVRAVKKRIVGRKLSVVDSSMDEEIGSGPAWVYDAAVSSVESPSSYFDVPLSPAAGSPSRAGFAGSTDEGDYSSRKRRFSFLAARGF